jgi:hypothetical protein
MNGLVYEIDGFIDEYKALVKNYNILTGGDTEFGFQRLKYHICQFKFSLREFEPNISI